MKILLTLFVLFFSFPSYAVQPIDFFYGKWLCIQDQATGFSWKSNEWVKTDFKPEKFIAEMLPIQDVCLGKRPESSKYFEPLCSNVWQFGTAPFFETPSYGTYWTDADVSKVTITDTLQFEMRISDNGAFTMHKESPGDPSPTGRGFTSGDQWIISTGTCEKL